MEESGLVRASDKINTDRPMRPHVDETTCPGTQSFHLLRLLGVASPAYTSDIHTRAFTPPPSYRMSCLLNAFDFWQVFFFWLITKEKRDEDEEKIKNKIIRNVVFQMQSFFLLRTILTHVLPSSQ